MSFYILDSNFKKIALLEDFESMIWTDRYSQCGDFEMLIRNNSQSSQLITPDKYIANSESDRLMIPETRSLGTDIPDGLVEISGNSLEYIIDRRPTASMTSMEEFQTGKAAYLILMAVHLACVANEWNVPNPSALPRFRVAFHTAPDTPQFTMKSKKSTAYEWIQEIAPIEAIGFKVTIQDFLNWDPYNGGIKPPKEDLPWLEKNMMVFETYIGKDRTSRQSVNPLVAFRPDLENLSKSQYLESTLRHKNMANVWGDDNKYCLFDVHSPSFDPFSVPSEELRWMMVDANDIQRPSNTADFDQLLRARGLAALSDRKKIQIFDGEVYNNNSYVYNRDYFMGDIVELADAYGHKGNARVTEYIWAQDRSGIRAYPTFSTMD